jgi:hypothetical protein
MSYKYSLDKTSKKFICPVCNKKRFVRYFDFEKNNYLPHEYGRCDRESSCGYHLTPATNPTFTTIEKTKPLQAISTISEGYVNASTSHYNHNNLFQFLLKHFSEEEILQCFQKYQIGTSKIWNGSCVFWQIDMNNNVRSGKIMLIDSNSGKRIKKPYPHINWVHKVLNLENYNLKQCYFGEHLLQRVATNSKIALVESEKTAITMSLFLKDYVWVATGSKQNLNSELLKPYKNYNIVLFPDCGEFEDWNKKALYLNNHGYKIKCSNLLENKGYEKGTDLADLYFDFNQKKDDNTNQKVHFSISEKKLQRLANINPAIVNLVKTFDLIDDKGNGLRIM